MPFGVTALLVSAIAAVALLLARSGHRPGSAPATPPKSDAGAGQTDQVLPDNYQDLSPGQDDMGTGPDRATQPSTPWNNPPAPVSPTPTAAFLPGWIAPRPE